MGVPENCTEVLANNAENFAGRTHENGWDIAFFDPPYNSDYGVVLFEFGTPESTLLNDAGTLIAEHHSKTTLPDSLGELRRWRILKQGETNLSFYERS